MTIRELFQLLFRTIEGFIKSLVKLSGVALQVLDYNALYGGNKPLR
jgi:hypothetical protein